jgi:hypothetical protein
MGKKLIARTISLNPFLTRIAASLLLDDSRLLNSIKLSLRRAVVSTEKIVDRLFVSKTNRISELQSPHLPNQFLQKGFGPCN